MQASPTEQLLPSLQLLPSSRVAVPTQTPPMHMSLVVQPLASLQKPPSALGLNTQPLAGAQLLVVHGLPSSQVTAMPEPQLPAEQISFSVQGLPSSHAPTGVVA
jgi:hypothetical protein